MGKILDLSSFIETTLDVKMPNGDTIHLRKPTQKMVITMLRLREDAAAADPEKQLAVIDDCIYEILNTNNDGKTYTKEDVANLSIAMKSALIKGYSEFIAGIQSDPN